MGIFGRDEKNVSSETTVLEPAQAPAPRQSNDRETTVIAGPTVVKGRLIGGSDIRVEGTVEGSVRSDKRVVVHEKGRIRGDVHARLVVIAGEVEGDITADERIELAPSGSLTGDITAPRILIQEGAAFEGQVNMEAPGKESAASGSSSKDASSKGPKGDKIPQEGERAGGDTSEAKSEAMNNASSSSARRSDRHGGRKK